MKMIWQWRDTVCVVVDEKASHLLGNVLNNLMSVWQWRREGAAQEDLQPENTDIL